MSPKSEIDVFIAEIDGHTEMLKLLLTKPIFLVSTKFSTSLSTYIMSVYFTYFVEATFLYLITLTFLPFTIEDEI